LTKHLLITPLLLVALACAPKVWRAEYLAEQVNVATQEQIQAKLGPPLGRQTLANGEEVWTYRVGQNAQYGEPATYGEGSVLLGSGECVAYVLTFDQQRVLHSWLRQEC
jgi:hypothetical protein